MAVALEERADRMTRPLLDCIELGAREKASATVLLLHGLGANGDDLAPLVPYFAQPDVRFVLPNAPERPVTINGGYRMPAWYDIERLGEAGGENEEDVLESTRDLDALVAREVERGIPASRVVLAGFSQGGALALHAGTRYPDPLLGIVVLSGYEVRARTREEEASPRNRTTPILFCHGTEDPMVPLARGRAAYEAHRGEGRSWHEFPMGHEICEEEIALVRDWLKERVAT
jgi:phospholipase/carboxylesterase